MSQRIDWDQARQSGEMVDYMNTVKSHLAPLLNTSHESVQDVDQGCKEEGQIQRRDKMFAAGARSRSDCLVERRTDVQS